MTTDNPAPGIPLPDARRDLTEPSADGEAAVAPAKPLDLLPPRTGIALRGTFLLLFYMSGVALLALAAWQPESREAPATVESWSMLLVPAAFVLTAVGINSTTTSTASKPSR